MKGTFFISTLLVCLSLAAFVPRESITYKGMASDLESGEFYYTEEHEEWKKDESLTETFIIFKDNHQRTIATKKIEYTKSTTHPDFVQEDLRDGYLEAANTTGDITALKCRKNYSSKTITKRIHIPEPAVIDGGFNYFVKTHWDALIRGNLLTFNFAVPSQLNYYAFRIYKSSNQKADNNTISFTLEPDQFLLRALVKPVIITYSITAKRIIKYEGISNINDEGGKSYHVRIYYPVMGP